MSETDTWRGACASTIRDKYPASLHRIVRLCVFIHHRRRNSRTRSLGRYTGDMARDRSLQYEFGFAGLRSRRTSDSEGHPTRIHTECDHIPAPESQNMTGLS
jgi:hypothetical protein